MNCTQVREMLSLYIDNLIENEDAREIEAHLAVCDQCRKEYEELLHITEMLGSLPEVELPESFDERLHAALLEVNAERERITTIVPTRVARRKKNFMKRVSSVAAIFVVGIFAIAMYNNSDQLMTNLEKSHDEAQYVTEKSIGSDDFSNETANDTVSLYDAEMREDAADEEPVYNAYSDTSADVVSDAVNTGAEEGTAGLTDGSGAPDASGVQVTDPVETEDKDAGELVVTPVTGTSDGAVSRGGSTAYDKLMLLYSTEGAIFVGRDLTAVHYYMDQLDILLEGTEFEIISCDKLDGVWNFEVETVSTDEEGNELRETVVYHGQDGTLWTEAEQL